MNDARRVRVRLRTEAVWDFLDRLNLTQNNLAARTGVSSGYLSMLMNGRRRPSPRVRRRLMDALGVEEFDDLFARERGDG